MFSRLRSLSCIIILFVVTITPFTASAQAPGYADITRPQPGEAISGLVTIEGSAAHPSFAYYELTFAYQPNPSDTWFPIMQPIQTSVTDGRLGIWDTTGISDGNYQLRLMVWLKNGKFLEAIVSNLRIRNTTPIETPTATQPSVIQSPIPFKPTHTPRPIVAAYPSDDGSSRVLRAFIIGGIVSAASLFFIGGYIIFRRYMNLYWATLRMRHLHRRTEQKRDRRRRDRR